MRGVDKLILNHGKMYFLRWALTMAVNLTPVSLTTVINAPLMLLTMMMQLELRISSRMFKKIRKGAQGIIRCMWEDDIGENL
jgi:hypothetical protein